MSNIIKLPLPQLNIIPDEDAAFFKVYELELRIKQLQEVIYELKVEVDSLKVMPKVQSKLLSYQKAFDELIPAQVI